MEKDRTENGQFMESLIHNADIGGRLNTFMPSAKVKTYIKDAILNRYAKVRRTLPKEIDSHIKLAYEVESNEIEFDSQTGISLHRLSTGEYVVAARTRHLKWETGLRKLLLFVAGKQGLIEMRTQLNLLLVIVDTNHVVNSSDKRLVNQALALADIKGLWV
ncbi:MAG: hypothetical protein IPK53_17770 [bacterium]|nr:hypothetical protein [bacterium]